MENMVPQDAKINRNDFKNFENELAREVNIAYFPRLHYN